MIKKISKQNFLLISLILVCVFSLFFVCACSCSQQGTSSNQNSQQQKNSTNNSSSNTQEYTVSMDQAKEIALKDAGVVAANTNFSKAVTNSEHGIPEHELVFVSGQTMYEYKIDGDTGAILDKSTLSTVSDD